MSLPSSILQPLHELRELRDNFHIRVIPDAALNTGVLKGVHFFVEQNSWSILIEDQYNDLREDLQLMALFLVLRALENYQNEPDFLKWCMHKMADSTDFHLLQYYRSLGAAIYDIEQVIGPVDSKISSLDYELRTGIIRELIAAG